MQAAPTDSSPPADLSGSLDDRLSNRVPLERQVKLHFEDFEGFVTECSMNVSATGMFIRCSDPQPAGSSLELEFSLTDGDPLIRGYGEVMWARRHGAGPDHPAGMGIRFLHLDAESRELIRWTVTRRYITGGGPCDVNEVKSAMRQAAEEEAAALDERPVSEAVGGVATIEIPPAPGEARPRYREAGYAAAGTEHTDHRSWRLVAAFAALVFGGLYLLQATSTSVDAASHAEVAVVAVAEPVAAEATPAASAIAPAPVVPAAANPPQPPAAPEQTPADLAAAWARAWSEQRATAYLAYYATDFRPPRGLSRSAWEEQRKVRILRPRDIAVELAGVATETLGPRRVRVRFRQTYRSESYRDVVRKTLELVREDGSWRILEERVEG